MVSIDVSCEDCIGKGERWWLRREDTAKIGCILQVEMERNL